ncbi:hypothetical protein EV359DRAFT_36234 [Lentinula novae-zelandiae]|nr:hypothetical protein EV359DRAFT_36234 [Lentinula novae-zelandiae]
MGPGTGQLALHHNLGVLREGDESDADVLRRQLLDKDRECDPQLYSIQLNVFVYFYQLKTTLSLLQSQLSLRPPVEHVQALEREYKDLELLLEGTQRENERCMAEMERMKIREKMLERELARLAGDNWQSSLDISPFPPAAIGTLGRSSAFHQRSNTAPTNTRMDSSSTSSGRMDPAMLAAHIEKVRLLIMGMETRISKREDHLQEMVKRAESERRKWEEFDGGVRA